MAVYKSCKWIEHGIILDHSNILRHCCLHNPNNFGRPIVWENYTGSTDWSAFFKIKNEHREIFKRGDCLPECKDCIMLETKDWNESNTLEDIILTPWIDCNSRCIYCWSIENQEIIKNTKKYNVTKVIDSLIKKNILLKTSRIDFAGGEPTIYEDFENLLKLFINKGFKDIIIHTSAVKYSKSIEKGLNKGLISLLISVDAGTEETHKKIKRVESFNIIWRNIEKYIDAQKKHTNRIKTKYILVPGINDSEKEIELWLNKNKQIGITTAVLNLDHNWLNQNFNNIPLYLYKLMNYSIQKSNEIGLELELFPQIKQLKEKIENDTSQEQGGRT